MSPCLAIRIPYVKLVIVMTVVMTMGGEVRPA
jgi:hypothetical protein